MSGTASVFLNDGLRSSLFFWQPCLLLGFIEHVQLIPAADDHIQSADHVLLLHGFGVICTFFHLFPAPFQILLFYRKKYQNGSWNAGFQGIWTDAGNTCGAYVEGIPPIFSGTRKALDCSIFRSDMSQSNYCQIRIFTSSEFLGYRKRFWASIRL